MERKLLSDEDVDARLKEIEGWEKAGKTIERRFEFPNFTAAIEFVNRVGAEAERLDHHPDIKLGWGYAEIATTTHDRGGITDMDVALAVAINALGPNAI